MTPQDIVAALAPGSQGSGQGSPAKDSWAYCVLIGSFLISQPVYKEPG